MLEEEDNTYAIGNLMIQMDGAASHLHSESNSTASDIDSLVMQNGSSDITHSPQTPETSGTSELIGSSSPRDPSRLTGTPRMAESSSTPGPSNLVGPSETSQFSRGMNHSKGNEPRLKFADHEISSTVKSKEDLEDNVDLFNPKLEDLDYQAAPPPFLGYVPYSSLYQGPSGIPYAYTSTPFPGMHYNYPQPLETGPHCSHPMFVKDMFHPAFLSNVSHHYMNSSLQRSHNNVSQYYLKSQAHSSFKDNVLRFPYKDVNNNSVQEVGEVLRQDSGFVDEFIANEELTDKVNGAELTSGRNVSEFQSRSIEDFEEFEEKVLGKSHLESLDTDDDFSVRVNPPDSLLEASLTKDKILDSLNDNPFLNQRTLLESSFSSGEDLFNREQQFDDEDDDDDDDGDGKEEGSQHYDVNDMSLDESDTKTDRVRPEKFRNCKSVFQRSLSNDSLNGPGKRTSKSRSRVSRYAELLRCNKCDYTSYNKSNFKNHLFIHSEERLFACQYCSYRGKQSAGLRAHLKVHSVEKPFKCSVCNYKCKRKQNLIQHFRIHSRHRPFACSRCEYRSTTKQSLQKHMIKHCGNMAFGFQNEAVKDDHSENVGLKGNDPIETYTDNTSIVKFEQDGGHNVPEVKAEPHGPIKDRESPYLECPYCEFTSIRKCAFRNHVKSHQNNPFKCSFCDFKCKTEDALSSHMSSHKVLNILKCMHCNFETRSAVDFVSHLNEHKPEEEVINHDSQPKSTSSEREGLKVAEITKKMHCPYCSFDSDSIVYLKLHVNNHSEEDFLSFKRQSSSMERSDKDSTASGGIESPKEDGNQAEKLERVNKCNQSGKEGKNKEVEILDDENILEEKDLSLENLKKILEYENINGRSKFDLFAKCPKTERRPNILTARKANKLYKPFRNLRFNFNFFKSRTFQNIKLKRKLRGRSQMLKKKLNENRKGTAHFYKGKMDNDCTVQKNLNEISKVDEENNNNNSEQLTANCPNNGQLELANSVLGARNKAENSKTPSGACNAEENINESAKVSEYDQVDETETSKLEEYARRRDSYGRSYFQQRNPEALEFRQSGRNLSRIQDSTMEYCDGRNIKPSQVRTALPLHSSLGSLSFSTQHFYDKSSHRKDIPTTTACPENGQDDRNTLCNESKFSLRKKSISKEDENKDTIVDENSLDNFRSSKFSYLSQYESFLAVPNEGGTSRNILKNLLNDDSSSQASLPEETSQDTNANENNNGCSETRITEDENNNEINFNAVAAEYLGDNPNSIADEHSEDAVEFSTSGVSTDPLQMPLDRSSTFQDKILDDPFYCTICGTRFKRKSSLVNHKRSHEKSFFKCRKCPLKFKLKKELEEHEKIHKKGKLLKCSECDFTSLRKCSLMSHYRIHRRKFKCIYCSYQCSLIKQMENHYAKHNENMKKLGANPEHGSSSHVPSSGSEAVSYVSMSPGTIDVNGSSNVGDRNGSLLVGSGQPPTSKVSDSKMSESVTKK